RPFGDGLHGDRLDVTSGDQLCRRVEQGIASVGGGKTDGLDGLCLGGLGLSCAPAGHGVILSPRLVTGRHLRGSGPAEGTVMADTKVPLLGKERMAASLREQAETIASVDDPFARRSLRVAYHLRRYAAIYAVGTIGLLALAILPTVGGRSSVAAGGTG